MTKGLKEQRGSSLNRVTIGGQTDLLGDPAIRLEKPYTIITFPGGNIEIARTSDGDYWVHVAVHSDGMAGGTPAARIVRARMDHNGRYNDEGNAALQAAVEAGDVNHVAFLVQPPIRHKGD